VQVGALLLVSVTLFAGGCGGRALVAGAGDVDAAEASTPLRGRAFDVTATFTVTPPREQQGGWSDFPKTQAQTLVLVGDSLRYLVGSDGSFWSTSVAIAPDGTFHTSLFSTLPYGRSCTGVATITFDEASFTESETALVGSGHGTVTYQYGADEWSAALTATFAGSPDRTPPSLAAPTAPVDPLAELSFAASEPLPATVSAKLVGATSGDVIALQASRIEGPERAIRAFAKPNVMLRAGETYRLVVDGLVDFAGNAPAGAPPATITTRPVPPLAAPDGFESVTGDTFGGAGVLADGPLTALAGQKSLLLNTGFGGGFGFLPYSLGPSLAVRLAVPPGATLVRFERQLIAPDSTQGSMFVGAIRLASVGHPVDSTMNLAATDFTKQTLSGNGDVYVSPVATIELPLPPGATGEVTFEIDGVTFQCGLPPPPTVLVVDGLRVE
jgi:hypothetical protein